MGNFGGSKMHRSSWEDVDQSGKVDRYVYALDSEKRLESLQHYVTLTYEMLEVSRGNSVLDVGCGTGDDAINLYKIVGPKGRVVGIDYSAQLIAEAKARAEKAGASVEFYVGDAHELSQFGDNCFDATRAAAVFHHLESPEKALKEMIRVVKPGGSVVIAEADWETLLVDHPNIALTRQIMNYQCDENHQNGWIGRQLPRLFGQSGLDVHVAPAAMILPSYDLANLLFGLENSVNKMETKGLISQEGATQWLNELKLLDGQGLFLASVTGFIVKGKKG
jgi:ubiquinone/menaquinone biosynthesis C-methylase UbiE